MEAEASPAGFVQIFRNGNLDTPTEYNGPRDSAGIVSYLEKASGPPSAELKSLEDVRPPFLPHPFVCPCCTLLRCWMETPGWKPQNYHLHVACTA